MSNDLQVYQEIPPMSAAQIRGHVQLIGEVMQQVMKKDEHYGVIPGTGSKPSLLKAGAEKLCLTFRLAPQYDTTEKMEGDHMTVVSKCSLIHQPTGRFMGTGMGSCSTKESKYAYRKGERKCPSCGKETIIKGRQEYGGGWICFAKKGGCGSKFSDGDQTIEGQQTGRTDNPDKADQYNTVLKMANKRSLVAAVLNVTAASDIFTQDIEDMPDFDRGAPDASPEPRHREAPEPTPEAPSASETDWYTTLKDAGNLTNATQVFNDIPQANRKPNSPAHKAFQRIVAEHNKTKAAA